MMQNWGAETHTEYWLAVGPYLNILYAFNAVLCIYRYLKGLTGTENNLQVF
jgi:hypothetical protein